MDLVVGRVAKAHGVTGEIIVEVRTDDPDTRFAAGVLACAAGHLAAGPKVATSSSRSASTAGGCSCGSTGWPTATPPSR